MKSTSSLRALRVILCLLVVLLSRPSAAALIVIDYTHDTFFAANPTAKAALEAAAADLSAAITTSLSAITAAHDPVVGTAGGTTVSFDHDLIYTNPTTNAEVTIATPAIALDTVRVFAGVRNLAGDVLGVGGPGSYAFGISASFDTVANLETAVASAASQSSTIYGRGGGPVIDTVSGALTGSGFSIPFSISYGLTLGNIWFDVDGDNDGITDTDLSAYWHFDHTTSVAAGRFDFYSVALHELMHVVGIGTSESWTSKVSGSDWLGPEVIALVGSGAGLITGGHIAEGTMSRRILDGAVQEVVMDPTLTAGTRKSLTELDLAFLRDIGWSTTAVPEPSTWLLSAVGLAGLISFAWLRRQRM